MTDYQAIIDNIRTVLCGEVEPNVASVAALESEYVSALQEVNKRLKACDALLHKRNRPEAIRMCEIEPPIMEVVGILDFAEREEWAEFVKGFGLPAPPEVLFDVAGDLNEAYMSEKPVANLMRLHRLYALGRVSLNYRIDVMRKLAQTDKGSSFWDEDLKTFEKARHNQIREEVLLAIKQNDVSAIAGLEREMREQGWRVPPSRAIVEKATQAHTRMRAEQARSDLRNLEPQLTAAHSHFDVERGRALRQRWNKLASIADLPRDDPLQELVAPTLDWLAEEDRKECEQDQFARNVVALEKALDDGATQLELERISRLATQHGRELPPVFASRMTERLRYLTDQEARRSKLWIVGVVSTVALVAGLMTTAVVLHARYKQLEGSVANLAQLINDGKLPEAVKYLAEIEHASSRIAQDPRVLKLRGDLEHAQEREAGRRLLRQQFVDAVQKDGIDAPAWETADRVEKDLAKAIEVSANDEEMSDVKRLERQVRSVRQKMQVAVDSSFHSEVTRFAVRVKDLRSDDVIGMDALLKDGSALRQKPYVSRTAIAQIDPLLRKIEQMQSTHSRDLAEAVALQNIAEIVGNLDAFRDRLQHYVRSNPGAGRAHDFERVLKTEITGCQGVDAWERLVQGWLKIEDFSAIDPAQAAALQKDAAELLGKYNTHPARVDLSRLMGTLAAVSKRAEGGPGAGLAAHLTGVLTNPTVADLIMVQSRTGQRYYDREVPQRRKDDEGTESWDFRYFKDATLTKRSLKQLQKTDVAVLLSTSNSVDWAAPQSKFSSAARRQLAALKNNNWKTWDSTFLSLITELTDDSRMDPIIKLQLLSLFFDVARRGSLPLELAFAKNADAIREAAIDNSVNWFDPDDKAAAAARRKCEQVLADFDKSTAAAAAVATFVADLKKPLQRPSYQWVAWLHRDREQKWTCTPSPRNASWQRATGTLWVLDVADGGATRFVKLGTLQDGKPMLTADATPVMSEGKAVFFQASK